MNAGDWAGRGLGTRVVSYTDRDPILYALALGVSPSRLDLVFEERLRVLPTFGLTLAQWAPDALGSSRAFDTSTAVHGAQRLRVLAPLPRAGEVTMAARVSAVWDKGAAAVFDVEVSSDFFVATWSIFAPGCGGFGGERGPRAADRPEGDPDQDLGVTTTAQQPALYRLLGDRHAMHVDPAAAAAAGMPRPFMHGLCTIGMAVVALADSLGVHPASLTELSGRFAAPVFPGDTLRVQGWNDGHRVAFEATVDGHPAVTAGHVGFGG
ncbi:probable dehydrogenase [Alloactinosynnema sp. L-07]|uniref:MaoC/PaaZ C-terminal domain-containing protein n=1 Tax=Alloactinosynnema sp. L-07 TaxID=1653480 RepID=UPI00065F096B|nr:MaoC/PaaZ C-terminal domain-containing protein [Alloactinosynnema sp. L-07]CRK57780.1 probable dehydrogenase [Alloactinosynnema sp. L-07]